MRGDAMYTILIPLKDIPNPHTLLLYPINSCSCRARDSDTMTVNNTFVEKHSIRATSALVRQKSHECCVPIVATHTAFVYTVSKETLPL